MTEHTQGPWRFGRGFIKGKLDCVTVAEVRTLPDFKELKANVSLITSAPDLLAKLEETMEFLNFVAKSPVKAWETIHGRAIDLAPTIQALISEAKGEDW